MQACMSVTFDEVQQFVEAVAEKYGEEDLSGVYAPARGGLIFGVWLSHKLHIPLVMSPVGNCLIVDDIADTGKTLEKYAGKFPIATMFYHKDCSFVPDFWMFEKKDEWIIYPWEE